MIIIVDLQMQEVRDRLEERGLNVELTELARKWLADEGYDPAFGARPLRRALQKHVESPLSVKLLKGEFSEGDTIIVDVDDLKENLIFRHADEAVPAETFESVDAQ
jgi:ATP-dependent Clp protease ATP-binding subunit ClpC